MRYFEDNKDSKKARKREFQECFTNFEIIKDQTSLFLDIDVPLGDLIDQKVLEICCGESPYLITNYDVITGKHIPILQRCRIVDLKFHRILKESKKFLKLSKTVLKNTFAFDIKKPTLRSQERICFSLFWIIVMLLKFHLMKTI